MKFLRILSLILAVLFSTKAFSGERFAPNNCEFSATFPSQYTAQQGYLAAGVPFDVAWWAFDGSMLKAECIGINRQIPIAEMVKDTLFRASSAFGLYGATVTSSNKNDGKIATLTGYKDIQGMTATYQISFFAGASTALIVYTGSESQKYPTKEISDFISSIRPAHR